MRSIIPPAILVSVLASLGLSGCQKLEPPPLTQVVVKPAGSVPLDPADPAWRSVPEFSAKLLPQDLVEPRLMKTSTEQVRVRAMSHEGEVAFRLEWAAPEPNDLPGAARFSDACAVQFPAKIEPTVPAPQMGEAGRPVEITYWRASWQATVDGRGDSIKDLYPNATVDHYPFEAASLKKGSAEQKEMALRYAPARAMENAMAGPRKSPVQDLVAAGPGTITAVRDSASKGCGKRTPEGWAVVIVRKLPTGLGPQTPSQVAFAVWQGREQEVGSRKMRTGWIPVSMQVMP